ncbi:MAG TPA: M20/M25/M40 family metallo-hydrolase, partial [Spirochaetota bacterium]|nr:M20/M25/M40 family metallo-hydrolase [Spirochaetota bacterium]
MVDQEALVRDAVALVRTPSLSGQERAAARLFGSQLEALGFDEVRTDASGNVIGIIRGGRPGGRIMFEGHIDTVPEGDVSLWTREPYGGEVSGGRIWGRGTSDMKGALVAMAHGLANVIPHKTGLSGELVLTAVVCEEIFEGIAFGQV